METFPIPSARKQQPTTAEGAAAASRKTPAQEAHGDSEGQLSASGFSKLLKSAGQPDTGAMVQGAEAGMTSHTALAMTSLAADVVHDVVLPVEQDSAQEALLGSDMAWSLQSLVGQTARLDQAADIDLRNGSHLQSRMDAGGWGGAMGVATAALGVAAHVPVVAQGVLSVAEGVAAQPVQGMVAGAASLAAGIAQGLEDGLSSGAHGELDRAGTRLDPNAEGRMSLQGQWSAAERTTQSTELMQRLLGQMSQFLAATGATESAGLRRSGGKSVDDAAVTVQDLAGMSSGGGQGAGRLMEQSVAQTAASQQAQNGNAFAEQSEQEVAYWMNARQQRAEVVLDRGGDPVRVQVQLEGNAAHVTFLSDASATREMLDASISQLRDLLAAQGVELAGVQVQTESQAGQDEPNSAPERFVPEGARRMRVGVDSANPSLDSAGYQGRISQRSVDIFA